MDIYIGNIPNSTSVLQLRKLFGDAGRNARFRLYNRKSKTGKVVCFGHAVVMDEKSGREVIQRLDGCTYNGCALVARPFIHRSDSNDRRARMRFPMPCEGINRRRGERRNQY